VDTRIVWLASAAPPKPALGAACNGCGVCCASEPCPVGRILSLRRNGACRALRWSEAEARYRCGWLDARGWNWTRRLAARWIAAGNGCDSSADAAPAG